MSIWYMDETKDCVTVINKPKKLANNTKEKKAEIPKFNKEEYLKEGGSICPYCGSNNITASRLQADVDYAWGTVTCEDCGEIWTDHYTLTDVERR